MDDNQVHAFEIVATAIVAICFLAVCLKGCEYEQNRILESKKIETHCKESKS